MTTCIPSYSLLLFILFPNISHSFFGLLKKRICLFQITIGFALPGKAAEINLTMSYLLLILHYIE